MPHTEDCLLQELYEDDGNIEALFTTFWRLPLLYLTLMAVRFVCIAVFNPLFQLTNAGLLSAIHPLIRHNFANTLPKTLLGFLKALLQNVFLIRSQCFCACLYTPRDSPKVPRAFC